MEEWKELYSKQIIFFYISIHIKENKIILRILDNITMTVYPSVDEAISNATGMVIHFKKFEKKYEAFGDI